MLFIEIVDVLLLLASLGSAWGGFRDRRPARAWSALLMAGLSVYVLVVCLVMGDVG